MADLAIQIFQEISDARAHYLRQVDDACAGALSPVIAAHEIKYREALAGGGPWIDAEAEALSVDNASVIESILAARSAWEDQARISEASRIKAKADIRRAQSPAEMHAILQRLR